MKAFFIVLIVLVSLYLLFILSLSFYKEFFKRFWDIVCSLLAIIVFSPLYLVLIIAGAIAMKGNPFFTQDRPGKNEKIFKLIKFRTMTNEKDKKGNLLPDEKRLNKYGKFLRSTSLDEIPEIFNILIGDMSIVGPRPLLVKYLPFYTKEERHRHDVRPGLTGYSQVHGRNNVDWTDKFKMDVKYIKQISFFLDIEIIFKTVLIVLKRENINQDGQATMEDFAEYAKTRQL